MPFFWESWLWCSWKQVTLTARHIPVIQAWPDHPSRVVSSSRGLPVDKQQVTPALSKSFCNKVQQQIASICVSLPWEDLDPYAFLPVTILRNVVEKLQDDPCRRIILIALGWPNMPWFWKSGGRQGTTYKIHSRLPAVSVSGQEATVKYYWVILISHCRQTG